MFNLLRKKAQTEVVSNANNQETDHKDLLAVADSLMLDTKIDKTSINGLSMPITQLATLGTGVSSMLPSLQAVSGASATSIEGLYRLANASVGDTLKVAKNGNFWGAFKTADGGSKFVQLQKADIALPNNTAATINPATMMMAVALFSIEQQLGRIEKMEKEILSFLETEKESEIEADVAQLYDILSKYKLNWDNEHFIASNHKMVLDIQRTARKNMIGFQKKLAQILETKQLMLSQAQVNSVLRDMVNKTQYYRLSLFSFSLASLIEVMLSGNFKEENISNVKSEIEKASMAYRELFSKCSVYLEKKSKGSVETQLLKGVGNAGKAAGNFIGSIPVVKRGPVDEFLQDEGKKLKKNASKMETKATGKLSEFANPETGIFIEKMDDLIQIFNHTESIAFDREKIFLITE